MARKEEQPLKIHGTLDQALKALVNTPKKRVRPTPKTSERKGKR